MKLLHIVLIGAIGLLGHLFFTAPLSAENNTEKPTQNVWDRAKLRGVSFRAIGQEPTWLLEITDNREILLITDYGKERNSYSYVKPKVFQHERRTKYYLPVGGIIIEIVGTPCTDIMNGEKFATTVTIATPERGLRGCGRAL